MSNFIVYNSTRFFETKGKHFIYLLFIVYLVPLNNRYQENGTDEKGQVQKSGYLGEGEKYALKNDSGEKYRHDGLDRYGVWEKNSRRRLYEIYNKFRNEITKSVKK